MANEQHTAARFARIITPILLTISLLANFYFDSNFLIQRRHPYDQHDDG